MRAFKSAVAKSRARLLVTCLLMWMASILSAQTQQLPPDHPAVGAPDGRSAASDLTERLRPSSASPASIPIARKNLIDEFIFGKMEKAGVPHAGLSSEEEFFRRIHIDLTGRLPQDEPLRAFLASRDPDKRDKLIDQLTTSRPYETKWTYFFNDIFALQNIFGCEPSCRNPSTRRAVASGMLAGMLPPAYSMQCQITHRRAKRPSYLPMCEASFRLMASHC